MISEQLQQELDRLLAQLAQEENRFQSHALEMQIDDHKMNCLHTVLLRTHGMHHNHVRMKEVHEALFKVHRKIQKKHQQAIQHGLILRERAREGRYEDVDLAPKIERLHQLVFKIRTEHDDMERERLKIITEHKAYAAALGLKQSGC